MHLPEPDRTRLDLRGRLCGVPVRVHPLFWFSAAALGVRYYADPEAGGIDYFAFWMVAALVSVLLHALGQALVGRLFGMRGAIVLYGFGSLVLGVESLPRWGHRVAALLAGPAVQFLLVCVIWGLTALPTPETLSAGGWQTPVATGAAILVRVNLYWGLLNVVPLWPLTGGRIASGVCESLLGSKGRTVVGILSLGVIAVLSVWVVLDLSWHLERRYDPRYLLYLEESGILLVFCFLLWVRNFGALWAPRASVQE